MPISVTGMNANWLSAGGGDFEVQRANAGILQISGIMSEDLVTLSVESFPIPKTTLTPIELNWMNERRKVPGSVNVEDIDVVFKDFVDNPTLAALTDWWLQTYDPETGRIGLARNYKKEGLITLYGPEGGFDREYKLLGLWITSFDPGDIDATSEDKKVINLSLSIDKVIPGRGIYTSSNISPAPAVSV